MTHPQSNVLLAAVSIAALAASCQPSAIAGDPGVGDPYYPELGNGGYDVQRYVICLDVDPEGRHLTAKTTIEAIATSGLSSFNLDFQGLEIDSLMVNAAPASYTRLGHELVVTPNEPLRSWAGFVVEITYHGTPRAVPSAASTWTVGWFDGRSGEVNVIAEPDGASTWFPSNDHPSDKALYRFEITVPQPWVAAATGTLLDAAVQDGDTLFVWEMDRPMATYLASVNIDHYVADVREGPGGVTIRNYLPVGIFSSLTKNLDLLPDMLSYFSDMFGPYPFSAYGVLVADGTVSPCSGPFGKALEAQSMSIHCPNGLMLSEAVVAHELAHQWFGDSVTPEKWQDIWLNEGAATYAEWLWLTRGQDVNALTSLANDERNSYEHDSRIGEPPADNLLDLEVYIGGAQVFHALRLQVGDEVFFRLLRTYLARYRYSNASTDEFMATAKEVTGQELSPFFRSWLMETELPPLPTPPP